MSRMRAMRRTMTMTWMRRMRTTIRTRAKTTIMMMTSMTSAIIMIMRWLGRERWWRRLGVERRRGWILGWGVGLWMKKTRKRTRSKKQLGRGRRQMTWSRMKARPTLSYSSSSTLHSPLHYEASNRDEMCGNPQIVNALATFLAECSVWWPRRFSLLILPV